MKTLYDLPDDWKKQLLDMYSEGAADVEIKAAFGLSHRAWNELMLDSDEFREAVTMGRVKSEAWWMKLGRTKLDERNFQQALWYRNMQNRFGWRDKSDSTTSDDVEDDDLSSVEDVEKEIASVASISGGKRS